MKKSPVGSWRSFFNLGKSSSVSKRKLQRNPSEPSEMKAIALAGEAPFQTRGCQQCRVMFAVGFYLLLASEPCMTPPVASSPVDLGQLWSLPGLVALCFAWNSFGKIRCGCCYHKSQDYSF